MHAFLARTRRFRENGRTKLNVLWRRLLIKRGRSRIGGVGWREKGPSISILVHYTQYIAAALRPAVFAAAFRRLQVAASATLPVL